MVESHRHQHCYERYRYPRHSLEKEKQEPGKTQSAQPQRQRTVGDEVLPE